MKNVLVRTQGHSYKILIQKGSLGSIGSRIEGTLKPTKTFIVTDENVEKLYLKEVLRSFKSKPSIIVLPPGEKTKTLQTYEKICRTILSDGVDRDSVLVALGGGVIGDLTGFAASTLLRGLRYVQVPTTLLAQVDSSVGGKTGVDTPEGKNLLGTFCQPELVVIDPLTLQSLPKRQLRNGYVELMKTALIADGALFKWLERNAAELLKTLHPALVEKVVHRACQIKAEIVRRDEKESGLRAILNFGHTFGHALELLSGYRVLHGEAVSVGMALAVQYAQGERLLSERAVSRILDHLRRLRLPTNVADLGRSDFSALKVLSLMKQDKKSKKGQVTLVLIKDLGRATIVKAVSESKLKSFLKDHMR